MVINGITTLAKQRQIIKTIVPQMLKKKLNQINYRIKIF